MTAFNDRRANWEHLDDFDEPLHADIPKTAQRSREEYMKTGGAWPEKYLAHAQRSKAFQANLHGVLAEALPEHVEVTRIDPAGSSGELRPIEAVSATKTWGEGNWRGEGQRVQRFRVPREDVVGLGYLPEGELFVKTHRAQHHG